MDTGHSNIYQITAVTVATLLQFLHKPLYQITEELIAETTLWWRCKLSNFHIYGFCFPKSPKKNNPIKTKHISPIYESSGGRCLVSNVMMTPRNKGESWKSISEKKTWQFVHVFRWIVLTHQAITISVSSCAIFLQIVVATKATTTNYKFCRHLSPWLLIGTWDMTLANHRPSLTKCL